MQEFLKKLECSNESFNPEDAFSWLITFLAINDRILYSTISNRIYNGYEESGRAEISGTLLSNIEALVRYSETPDNIAKHKGAVKGGTKTGTVDDARKAVLKIWDHVTLACHQYEMLKQTDDEYDDKFQKRITKYKEEISKEMNAQMLTMVGIFTALAFLIFGGISSLDGVFENISLPIFKVMSIGLIWGLCISNMIFVFLYCVGKMTNLSFGSSELPNLSRFERYPVVWWTNLTLIGLLLLSVWGYFIQQTTIGSKICNFANCSPWLAFWIGTLLILGLIVGGTIFLVNKTKPNASTKGKAKK